MLKSLSCKKKKKYIKLDALSTDFSLLHPQIQFLYSPLKCMNKRKIIAHNLLGLYTYVVHYLLVIILVLQWWLSVTAFSDQAKLCRESYHVNHLKQGCSDYTGQFRELHCNMNTFFKMYLSCMNECSDAYMYVLYVYVWCPQKSEEGVRSLELELQRACASGCWESNTNPQ